MKTRFITEVGTRVALRSYWDEADAAKNNLNRCPPSSTRDHASYHNGMRHLFDLEHTEERLGLGGNVEDYTDDRWPTTCDACQSTVPANAFLTWSLSNSPGWNLVHQVFRQTLYAAGAWRGEPGPGDVYIADWYGCAERGRCVYQWTNCDGRHLMVVLPNGHVWDVDSRASNCTMKEDTEHRCWIRHGDPASNLVHVDKQGKTCAAGAGSIAVPGFHGFLHHGELA